MLQNEHLSVQFISRADTAEQPLNRLLNVRITGALAACAEVREVAAASAGDPFSVYPAEDGTVRKSLRIVVFREALEDIRAMKLCEALYGKQTVIRAMEQAFGDTIEFNHSAGTAAQVLSVRAVPRVECET